MPKFIENNPFRVLGVYSNASLKDITANKTRISAYAKVGKVTSFPLDVAGGLPAVIRTPESIAAADHELALAHNKIMHALFWFANSNKIDEIAIGHFTNGDAEKAKDLLSKKETSTSLVNLAVIGIIEGNYSIALQRIYTLTSSPETYTSFIRLICGDMFTIEPFELWKGYIDVLLREKKASVLLRAMPAGCVGEERDYIKDKAIEEPIRILQTEISKAREITKNDDPTASYSVGLQLMQSAKKHLTTIKNLIGVKDLRYVNIADATANQILQCGINYYNETDDDDDVDKALVLQEYACSIAAGSLAVGRCKKNLEILKRKKEEEAISADVKFIANTLKAFQDKYECTSNARLLVETCKPHLETIKIQKGVSNELYIQISSAVANSALSMLVSTINKNSDSRSMAKDAMDVIKLILTLDVDTNTRERITHNSLILTRNLAQMPTDYQKVDNATGGCLSSILGYLILGGIIALIAAIADLFS